MTCLLYNHKIRIETRESFFSQSIQALDFLIPHRVEGRHFPFADGSVVLAPAQADDEVVVAEEFCRGASDDAGRVRVDDVLGNKGQFG
jgi:hypothetical protein